MDRKANFDPLTDLPNRHVFQDRLYSTAANAKRYKRSFALVYLDLDHFKQVNDTLGHLAGDALLVEAAQRMKANIRESDTIARIGGDEFALVCPEIRQLGEVVEIVERLLKSMIEPFVLEAGTCNVSVSIGIALAENGDDISPEELKRKADLALYDAKRAGRNCFRVFNVAD